ncbi:MAG: ComF family protein [Candidatus Pacebacteria bacterium]|nr:ComF family protein [Candidatus Paceibacterota bacterium]
MWIKIKCFVLDILFPKFCFNCGAEGSYLCEDCQAMLEISGFHRKYSSRNIDDLYFPLSYRNPLTKNLIQNFKGAPFVKDLAETLSYLIISHFQLLDNKPDFSDFAVLPLPLARKRHKWRGFNQAEEIGKALAQFFKIRLISGCLVKIKETLPQTEIAEEKRKENVRGAFEVKNRNLVKNKNILLVDDIYLTGSTMEECAKILKDCGAKEIVGIVVARG